MPATPPIGSGRTPTDGRADGPTQISNAYQVDYRQMPYWRPGMITGWLFIASWPDEQQALRIAEIATQQLGSRVYVLCNAQGNWTLWTAKRPDANPTQ